ncbi:MAG: rhamnogalacturonan acetylesterase [Panacagrimonas sp.]
MDREGGEIPAAQPLLQSINPKSDRLLLVASLLIGLLPIQTMAQTVAEIPLAVPTFSSIGLYWKGVAPQESNGDAQVQFRKTGEIQWQDGLPLWYDSREGEYRGSLVQLKPATSYEIRVTHDDSLSQTITARTWSEQFPIVKTVLLPEQSGETLTITESGSPAGYVLYTAAPGSSASINVGKQRDFNINIRASYVIIRGLSLRGASRHAIVVGDGSASAAGVTDVVIEDNDISAWGSASAANPNFGRDRDSAIYSSAPDLQRIVIQRNRLHHPSHDANSLEEAHGSSHSPRGPIAVYLDSSAGNHVIRYNEIYSDSAHYFRDGMAGGSDFSNIGFPNRDSDIHANYVANVWDEAISSAGANRNVRIWGNYIDQVLFPIGMAPNHGGPLYVWRNVSHSISSGPANSKGSAFFKIRNIDPATGINWGGGRAYAFNNSALVPRVGKAPTNFIAPFGPADPEVTNLWTLNNLMMVKGPTYFSIRADVAPSSAFDYDLFNGKIGTPPGQEVNGIKGTARLVDGGGFDPDSFTGVFALDSSSPGYDGGVRIPNFVNDVTGRAPDLGAHEAGTAPMRFGVHANLRIGLVGDSTVTNLRGWGLGFDTRGGEYVSVLNEAVSGTSSRSYRELGYWDQTLALKPDYLLIQFGHNDQPGKPDEKTTDPETTYKDNMTRYVAEARAAGIRPILVTSLTRRKYSEAGLIRVNNVPLTPYAAVVRALAPQLSVPLIDLHASSIAFFNILGPTCWQHLAATPEDITHLNAAGSHEVSRLVVQDLPLELRPYFDLR